MSSVYHKQSLTKSTLKSMHICDIVNRWWLLQTILLLSQKTGSVRLKITWFKTATKMPITTTFTHLLRFHHKTIQDKWCPKEETTHPVSHNKAVGTPKTGPYTEALQEALAKVWAVPKKTKQLTQSSVSVQSISMKESIQFLKINNQTMNTTAPLGRSKWNRWPRRW